MEMSQFDKRCPCDLCRFNPPSSGDGKPCSVCPASAAKMEYETEEAPKKEIHFYEDLYDLLEGKQIGAICLSWLDTYIAIKVGDENIVTTQMSFMSTKLIERGYRLFVHPAKRGTYEITLGACSGTDKEIRLENNLFQMWKNGAFSFSPPSVKGDII